MWTAWLFAPAGAVFSTRGWGIHLQVNMPCLARGKSARGRSKSESNSLDLRVPQNLPVLSGFSVNIQVRMALKHIRSSYQRSPPDQSYNTFIDDAFCDFCMDGIGTYVPKIDCYYSHCHSFIWLVVWNIFIFPYIGSSNPNWLMFFRGVDTTNQLWFWRQTAVIAIYMIYIIYPTITQPFPKLQRCQVGAGVGPATAATAQRSQRSRRSPSPSCASEAVSGRVSAATSLIHLILHWYPPIENSLGVNKALCMNGWFTIGLCTHELLYLLIFVGLCWWIHGFLSALTFHSGCFFSARLGISLGLRLVLGIAWRSQVVNRLRDGWKPPAYMQAWRMDQVWPSWIPMACGK